MKEQLASSRSKQFTSKTWLFTTEVMVLGYKLLQKVKPWN